MGFDRKKDFRSSFKEDKKSNEARKKCLKQAEASHGRAAASGATHGCAAWHSRAVPSPRATAFFSAFYLFLGGIFRGLSLDLFQSIF